jgi:hypothetical protein
MSFLSKILPVFGGAFQKFKESIMANQADFDAKLAELNTAIAGQNTVIAKLVADNQSLATAISTFIAENVSSLDISAIQGSIDGIINATADIQTVDDAIVAETASLTPTP